MRSKSFLAAEAIPASVEAETWQLDEIQAGLQELDSGRARGSWGRVEVAPILGQEACAKGASRDAGPT
jgi:hypothetical protein